MTKLNFGWTIAVRPAHALPMSIHPATRQLIKLTTHPDQFGVDPEPITWDARDPAKRGPVVATVSKPGKRNAIGAHSGTYSVYRAIALAAQAASPDFRPDFTNTLPPEQIGPHESWFVPGQICSLDPWGHVVQHVFEDRIKSGDLDVRPTIAVTKSHLDVLEVQGGQPFLTRPIPDAFPTPTLPGQGGDQAGQAKGRRQDRLRRRLARGDQGGDRACAATG